MNARQRAVVVTLLTSSVGAYVVFVTAGVSYHHAFRYSCAVAVVVANIWTFASSVRR